MPCGRTEKDKHLCCKRRHKWYNTYWILRKFGRHWGWEKYCLFCRNMVQMGGHPFERYTW